MKRYSCTLPSCLHLHIQHVVHRLQLLQQLLHSGYRELLYLSIIIRETAIPNNILVLLYKSPKGSMTNHPPPLQPSTSSTPAVIVVNLDDPATPRYNSPQLSTPLSPRVCNKPNCPIHHPRPSRSSPRFQREQDLHQDHVLLVLMVVCWLLQSQAQGAGPPGKA